MHSFLYARQTGWPNRLLTPILAAALAVSLSAAAQASAPWIPAEAPGTVVRGQLRPAGRWLAYPDGRRFRWRGVTGLALNEQVAGGRESEAAAFLAWARRTGFNVVRVFAMLPRGWFADRDFSPEEGLAALPRTLELARQADMYVQLTVLANTASLSSKADLGTYVERAGRACLAAENCALVEIANDLSQKAQRADARDPGSLARWARRVPAGIPTALGAPANEGAGVVATAPVITINLDKQGDRWSRLGRMSAMQSASVATGRFLIDNESVGAGETAQARWDNLAEVFLAQGALSRVMEIGANFHFEDGLTAKPPRPVQQKCAEAFIAGTSLIDDSYMLTFQNAGWPYSPVARTPVPVAYAGLTQVFPQSSTPSSILVFLGADEELAVEWRQPWHRTGVLASLGGVQVWSIGRRP